ncbi:MAG TPA: long-chain fatty acid--CoA ligase, partial [Acidimicrobiia bacterium]
MRSLGDLLFDDADTAPDTVLVEDVSGAVTRQELVDEARSVRDALVDLGVQPGLRVAAMLPTDAGT